MYNEINTVALNLIEEKKYLQLKSMLSEMHPIDIALLFEEIPDKDIPLVFRILPKELAAEVFVEMDGDRQEFLIKAFNDKELKEVFDELYLDDTVDIVEEMPANVVSRILKTADTDTRKMINEILKFPDDSAGSIMTIEYVSLRKTMTVDEAFKKIRLEGVDKETVYTCYVTENRKLIGVVTVKDMLLADKESSIIDIMETNVIKVETIEDKESVAHLFEKYDFLALPVVDKEDRLVGIVTFDDAMDVLQQEASEDFAKISAVAPIEDTYLKTSVLTHAKNRLVWLLILLVTATFTGIIISSFEESLAEIGGVGTLLFSFLPMLMDAGGNCGAQSSVLIIRGMAIDEIKLSDFSKVLFKELRIGVIVGVSLAVANFIRLMLMNLLIPMYRKDPIHWKIGVILGITLIGTVIIAKMLGCILPMFAKKCKLDPAIMASPFITTIVDACAVLMYFTVAMAIL